MIDITKLNATKAQTFTIHCSQSATIGIADWDTLIDCSKPIASFGSYMKLGCVDSIGITAVGTGIIDLLLTLAFEEDGKNSESFERRAGQWCPLHVIHIEAHHL